MGSNATALSEVECPVEIIRQASDAVVARTPREGKDGNLETIAEVFGAPGVLGFVRRANAAIQGLKRAMAVCNNDSSLAVKALEVDVATRGVVVFKRSAMACALRDVNDLILVLFADNMKFPLARIVRADDLVSPG